MLILLQILFWTFLSPQKENPAPAATSYAVELSFYDTTGKLRHLNEFSGKVVHLTVWASYCKGCKEAHDVIKEAQKNPDVKDVVWLFIGVDRDESTWKQALKTKAAPGEHMWAKPNQIEALKQTLGLRGIPSNFWFEPDGEIVYSNAPMPEGNWLKQLARIGDQYDKAQQRAVNR